MGLKFKLTGLLMIAMALTTTVVAIDLLKGVTLWDVAEMRYDDPVWDRHYKIEDYHPVPGASNPLMQMHKQELWKLKVFGLAPGEKWGHVRSSAR